MKQQTIDRIRKFSEDRDWDQFHSPANLAKSISIDMDERLADAMNAGLEIETDPAKIAEREVSEHGNTEELVIDATEVAE